VRETTNGKQIQSFRCVVAGAESLFGIRATNVLVGDHVCPGPWIAPGDWAVGCHDDCSQKACTYVLSMRVGANRAGEGGSAYAGTLPVFVFFRVPADAGDPGLANWCERNSSETFGLISGLLLAANACMREVMRWRGLVLRHIPVPQARWEALWICAGFPSLLPSPSSIIP